MDSFLSVLDPRTTLSSALKVFPAVTVMAALAKTADAKDVLELMLRVFALLVPITALPRAEKRLPLDTLTGALAVRGADAAKVAGALISTV